MEENRQESHEKNWLLWGSLYAAILVALGAYLNYSAPYSSGPVTSPQPWQLLLWVALYLPIMVLPLAARSQLIDFGFTLSPHLAISFIVVTLLCAVMSATARLAWSSAAIEAFARTGEEVFFRGFLVVFFTRLFHQKRRPWLWAALLSSILFALVHTQTFQPAFLSQYGSPPPVPALFVILDRFFNVFLLGLVFALLRVWTRSVLPGAIAHSISSAGFQTLPFVLLIYFLGILWASLRREPVIFTSAAQPN